MANILSGLLGQQRIPNFSNPSLGDLIQQTQANVPAAADLDASFNARLAPQLMDTQLGVERQYDPNAAAVRSGASHAILDQLNLGGSLPPDVQAAILQAGFQTGQGAGVGPSGAGRNLVARDIGTTSQDLLNQRIGQAANWARSGPSLNQLYSPTVDITPGSMMGFNTARTNAQNNYDQMVAQLKTANDFNAINTPIQIGSAAAGTAVGSAFGTTGMGSGFSSILKGVGGGSGAMQGMSGASFGNNGGVWNAAGNAVRPIPA